MKASIPASIFKRLISSSFVWTVLFLVAVDITLDVVKPFKYVTNWKYRPLNHNPVVSKIPLYLSSPEKPNMLIMGCSLPMTAIAAYDEKYAGSPKVADVEALRTYTKARYLENLLARKQAHPTSIFNLTCVGCMASDAEALLNKSLEIGKKPETIIYAIGPRSFVDNTIVATDKTAVQQLLGSWKGLKDSLSLKMCMFERGEVILSHFWKFFGARADYRNYITAVACDKVDRCPTIFAANQRHVAEAAAKPDKSQIAANEKFADDQSELSAKQKLNADLALYDIRYNPPNFTQFEEQEKHFQKFVELCQHNGIKLLVVAMPVTNENLNLLDKRLLLRYQKELPGIALANKAHYLDLSDSEEFSLSDFEDSVHTNFIGGKKVQDKIVQELSLHLSL